MLEHGCIPSESISAVTAKLELGKRKRKEKEAERVVRVKREKAEVRKEVKKEVKKEVGKEVRKEVRKEARKKVIAEEKTEIDSGGGAEL
jgi:hypothetical protein